MVVQNNLEKKLRKAYPKCRPPGMPPGADPPPCYATDYSAESEYYLILDRALKHYDFDLFFALHPILSRN